MGLGPLHTVTLAEARERARGARQTLLDGDDPIEKKRKKRAETARERISRDICTTLELRNVQRLLLKALPERPDLVVVLGHAVTELVTVYDIPYRDVPLIRSALYVLKEQWRYQLLEDWADAIVISLTQSCGEERLAA